MGFRIEEFDFWRAGYGGASVRIVQAGTDNLASIYFDEDLTSAAANPIILASRSLNGVNYGKFPAPVYIGVPYEMIVNSIDESGVISIPITTLAAQDASLATVQAEDGTRDITLAEILSRVVYVTDHGVFLAVGAVGASASTNNATLTAAIGVASANGGGVVMCPPGTYAYTAISIPANVILCGCGEGVTILQSTTDSATVTLSGDRAGYMFLTFDGTDLGAGSIGVYAKAQDRTFVRNAMVKRFETGIHCKGGRHNDWKDLSVDNCSTGAKLHGDLDTSAGDEWRHNRWIGGTVSTCTTLGIDLKYVDKKTYHNQIGVYFSSNTGTALRVYGARHTDITGSSFDSNTEDLEVLDGDDATADDENTVVGLYMRGGVIESDMSFTGKCQDIVFEGVEFSGGTYTLTDVDNHILARTCTEASAVALAGGDSLMWVRQRASLGDWPASFGVTTDNVATEAWSYTLAPGERVILEAKVIANGRNVNDYATYHIGQAARRPGSTLAYDGQTANFTAGATLTGGTSGATARIIADSDSGATGTLTLRSIVGEFIDNEAITDSSGGAAVVNGTLSHQNAALLGSITSIQAATETDTDFACIFGVTAGNVRVLVTGDSSKTVEWTVSVSVTSSE